MAHLHKGVNEVFVGELFYAVAPAEVFLPHHDAKLVAQVKKELVVWVVDKPEWQTGLTMKKC